MATEPTIVYRCLKARRWDQAEEYGHLPRFDPIEPGRWNDEDQWALYTAHTPDVAAAERQRHIPRPDVSPRSVFGSIATAIGDPIDDVFVVIAMPVHDDFTETATWDGRQNWSSSLDELLDPCGDARGVGRQLARSMFTRLIVKSSPRPDEWNSVLFCFGAGQPGLEALPLRFECDEVLRGALASTAPDCGT